MREIDAAVSRRALELVERKGLASEPILAKVGLRREAVTARGARIPVPAHVAIIDLAALLVGDPCFGLHLPTQLHPRDFGLLGYIALNCRTLGDAIQHISQFGIIFTEGAEHELLADPDGLRVVWHPLDPSIAGSHHLQDLAMSAALRVNRVLSGTMLAPLRVELQHDGARHETEYRRVLGAPVQFGQSQVAFVLPAKAMQYPIIGADPNLLVILLQYADELRRKRAVDRGIVARIKRELLRLLPYSSVSLDDVARALGMSTRTLSRQLVAHATTFTQILEQLRCELARRYLVESSYRVSTIAHLLGYSDISAFNHAFHRWTGLSPRAFRTKGKPTELTPANTIEAV